MNIDTNCKFKNFFEYKMLGTRLKTDQFRIVRYQIILDIQTLQSPFFFGSEKNEPIHECRQYSSRKLTAGFYFKKREKIPVLFSSEVLPTTNTTVKDSFPLTDPNQKTILLSAYPNINLISII